MLMRRSPASRRSWAISGRVAPLVVMARSTGRRVAARRRASFSTSTGRWARTVGSPPVRRMPSKPNRSTKIAGEPLDLLEGEQLLAGQPRHALGRHAVGAPEVAAVGDRDAQVAHRRRTVDERLEAHASPTPRPRQATRHRHVAARRRLRRRRAERQRVGQGHRRAAGGRPGRRRTDVVAAVGAELATHPGEVESCRRAGARSGSSATARTGAGRARRPGSPSSAQAGPGEQLEGDHRRHRVAGQAEHRACPPTSPKASGLAGRMATCIQRMSPSGRAPS